MSRHVEPRKCLRRDLCPARVSGSTAALLAAVLLFAAGCTVAGPRIDPLAETATVDLMWENRSDRRYFIAVGDPRENTLSYWFPVEPCQKAEVRGVVVTMPDDIGFGPADGAEFPSGPMTGAIDSVTLLENPQWTFWIVQDDPPDDMIGNLYSYGPPDQFVPPALPEKLC